MKRTVLLSFLLIAVLFSCTSEPNTSVRSIDNISSSREQTKSSSDVDDRAFDELVNDYEHDDREFWQRPQLVIQSLGDLSDQVVADIGAGTGYFTLRLLPFAKKVIAVDIDPRMTDLIDRLKNDLEVQFSRKLEVRLAEPHDPKLEVGEVDLIFLSNTYAHIDNRVEYFQDLRSKLTKNGRIVIVDFKRKMLPSELNVEDRVALYKVEQELMRAGYDIVQSDDQSLIYQYILQVKPRGR